MERTLSFNYPVLRQNKGVLLNKFVKKPQSLDSFFYPFLLPILMYNVVSFDCGVLRTYSVIRPYFALVEEEGRKKNEKE